MTISNPIFASRNVYLKNLYLHYFRNHKNRELVFNPRINAIYGDNAKGKTSLLEAIFLLTTGRSFRTQSFSELIQEGQKFFYIEATFVQMNIEQTIKISFDGKEKKLHFNATEFSSFSPLLGAFPSVFSIPNDMDLITDSPSCRRRFLNLHLAQSDPMYVHYLARYWRACKQRNCLLKTKNHESLFCWEVEMAQAAQYLFQARTTFINELKEPLLAQTISDEKISLDFKSSYPPIAKEYEKLLQKMRQKEMEVGSTLNGPHRDDFAILMNQKSAQVYGSEGQKKTIVTALRLSQWKHLLKRTNTPPLFAIDDYEGMLDEKRQSQLQEILKTMGQVFLTSPNQNKVLEEGSTHIID